MDNRLFAFKTSLLLQDSVKYAFIVSAFGDGECGISMSENDTITYITYIPPTSISLEGKIKKGEVVKTQSCQG